VPPLPNKFAAAPTAAVPSSVALPLGQGLNMSGDEFAVFQHWVARNCGLSLGEDKKYLLETRLARLLQEYQCDTYMDLYRRIAGATNPQLRDRIVDAVTTHETLWFRDDSPWTALRDRILPELTTATASRAGPIRIWSAGCSTGQEPYSIAMLVDDWCNTARLPGVTPARFEIVGTDVSTPALVLAMSGRYDAVSMRRGLTGPWERFRAAYFSTSGATSVVTPDIRARVRFTRHSLQDSFAELGRFDLIMMRYVTIYFSPEFKTELWPRISATLRPGGFFFLGAAETLLGQESRFQIERHERAYYYRTAKSAMGGI
jgi:chemotaxis protein methyltransferase CheR